MLRAGSDLTDPYERIKEALKQVCLTLKPVPVAQTPPHCIMGLVESFSTLPKTVKGKGALPERREASGCLGLPVFVSILVTHSRSASLWREEE